MLMFRGHPVRDQFENLGEVVYLRTGNINPCPRSVRAAMSEFLDLWACRGDACWERADSAFGTGKQIFAKLINADPAELATVENTSMGLSIAAHLIDPKPGSNVVVDELTHQSNVYPWLVRPGVEVRYARADGGRVDFAEFERLVDENTAAIDVCHVTMAHGFLHDLAALGELAHRHGGYLVVDAAQSAGAAPIDVRAMQVDFLSCPTFKWLLGPLGAGFLYVRRDLLELGPPPMIGWMSAKDPGRFDVHNMDLHDDARRLQRGVHNAIGLVGAEAGLRIIDEIGVERIREHVRGLSRTLMDGLRDMGADVLTANEDGRRAGIVTIGVPDARAFSDRLASAGVLAGQYLPEQIRMDVALFHDEADIERALRAATAASRGKTPG